MKEQTLEEYLESMVFDREELQTLKEEITAILNNDHNDAQKTLLTAILEYLAHIFDNLLGNIPFYFENVIAKQEIARFSNTSSSQGNNENYQTLMEQVKEKDEFLEQMAQRIQRIYANLRASE